MSGGPVDYDEPLFDNVMNEFLQVRNFRSF